MTIETQRQILDLAERLERWEKTDIPRSIYVRVYNNANITLTNNTVTTLTFNSERYDSAGMHSTTSNTDRLEASEAGWYVITGHVRFASNATGIRQVRILLNGSTLIAIATQAAITGSQTDMTITTQYYLIDTDYVDIRAYQNSGGDLAVESSSAFSPEFMMCRVP